MWWTDWKYTMRKCIRCKNYKDESEFNTRHFEKGYLQSVCRNCQQEQAKERYAKNTEGVKEMNKIARQRSKEQARRFVFEYLSQKSCADCGESDIEVLTFDHVRGQKEWNIADMVQHGYALKTIASEIEKTDDVCFNCHMRREQKRRGQPVLTSCGLVNSLVSGAKETSRLTTNSPFGKS